MMPNLALNMDLRAAIMEFPNGRLLFSHALILAVTPGGVEIKVAFHNNTEHTMNVAFEPDGSADFYTALARALIAANVGG